MTKAILSFSNGETLELTEGQMIVPIVSYISDGKKTVSLDEPKEIWHHMHDALIPSICELLVSCDFFYLVDQKDKVYNSNAVVLVRQI